jgi:hypothetical protein
MATAFDTSAFEAGTDPILQFISPEQARKLIEFRGDPEIQARIEDLASRNTEGELSTEEQTQYEGYVLANKFIAILQAKARKLVAAVH